MVNWETIFKKNHSSGVIFNVVEKKLNLCKKLNPQGFWLNLSQYQIYKYTPKVYIISI